MGRRIWGYLDWRLLGLTLFISFAGIIAIHSASRGYPGGDDFWIRQTYWMLNGLLVAGLMLFFSPRLIGRFSYLIHLVGVMILAGLLLKTGSVNRWYNFGGISIQPSEFVKLTMVLALAYHFRDGDRRGLGWLIIPLLIFFPPFLLVLQQPDLGTALVLLMIFLLILVAAGLTGNWMLTLAGVGIVGLIVLVMSFYWGDYRVREGAGKNWKDAGANQELVQRLEQLEGQRFYFGASLRDKLGSSDLDNEEPELWEILKQDSYRTYISYALLPYQQRRLAAFAHPESDPLGAGYHVRQSKVAVGSGGFFGKGLGNSTQGSLNFLPARHTDFIFAIFAEEWGFMGAMIFLIAYMMVLTRGFNIALQVPDRFGAFTVLGIMGMITLQMFINTGMSMGLVPVVGIPLPLVSYGGSSMLTSLAGLGLVLNIGKHRFAWN